MCGGAITGADAAPSNGMLFAAMLVHNHTSARRMTILVIYQLCSSRVLEEEQHYSLITACLGITPFYPCSPSQPSIGARQLEFT